jgi:hypothetical protein
MQANNQPDGFFDLMCTFLSDSAMSILINKFGELQYVFPEKANNSFSEEKLKIRGHATKAKCESRCVSQRLLLLLAIERILSVDPKI